MQLWRFSRARRGAFDEGERRKRLKEVRPHCYVDTQTGVIHMDLPARLRALGRPDDPASRSARDAFVTLRQWRAIGGSPRGVVCHLSTRSAS
jgi:hypothetical protein